MDLDTFNRISADSALSQENIMLCRRVLVDGASASVVAMEAGKSVSAVTRAAATLRARLGPGGEYVPKETAVRAFIAARCELGPECLAGTSQLLRSFRLHFKRTDITAVQFRTLLVALGYPLVQSDYSVHKGLRLHGKVAPQMTADEIFATPRGPDHPANRVLTAPLPVRVRSEDTRPPDWMPPMPPIEGDDDGRL